MFAHFAAFGRPGFVYSGIVQALQPVRAIKREADLARLELALGDLFVGLVPGASIAVNGVCVTVANLTVPDTVHLDLIAETLRVSNLGELHPGDLVNVERSMRVGDEQGGHDVSGHVSAMVRVVAREQRGGNLRLHLGCPKLWMKYIFHKGFVALDGASLTISSVDVRRGRFSVDLIPETRARTTLGFRCEGDHVNLEVDSRTQTIVETIERLFADPGWLARLRSPETGWG